jgi:hypothetical protein
MHGGATPRRNFFGRYLLRFIREHTESGELKLEANE